MDNIRITKKSALIFCILSAVLLFIQSCSSNNSSNDTISNKQVNEEHQETNNQLRYDKLINDADAALKKNIEDALNKYTLAIKIDSSKVEALYGLGVVYSFDCFSDKKDCPKAIEYLTKAIQVNPKYRRAYFNRSICKTMIGDMNSALSDLNHAIENNPSDPDYFNNRGTIKLSLGDKDGACKDFNKALNLGLKSVITVIEEHCQ